MRGRTIIGGIAVHRHAASVKVVLGNGNGGNTIGLKVIAVHGCVVIVGNGNGGGGLVDGEQRGIRLALISKACAHPFGQIFAGGHSQGVIIIRLKGNGGRVGILTVR